MKGVSLSLQTVIVGILLLIVLGVVLFVFMRGINGQDDVIQDNNGRIDNCFENPDACDFTKELRDSWVLVGLLIPYAKRRRYST